METIEKLKRLAKEYLDAFYEDPSNRTFVLYQMAIETKGANQKKKASKNIDYDSIVNPESLDPDLLKDLEPTFARTLFKLIKEKGISETECYKNANLDRRLFSKIRSDDNYQPRKATVFALIIGLKLNLEEAEDLLDKAGFSISHSMKLDTVMEFIIKKGIYDINTVNEILYSLDCPVLGAKEQL